ncbi:MAG: hypothetical protein JWM11_3130, partial [Planctomycetaceae bacterium]|nr:hypothetical protein [Planctomycetaceae bacterium]
MNDMNRELLRMTRRQLLGRTGAGIGGVALASLMNPELFAGQTEKVPGALTATHFPAKAKRVIYLVMSGGPSHIDLLDYKPQLKQHHGQELPASIRMGQRVTGMTSGQKSFPCASSLFDFKQHGKSGTFVSELLPNVGSVVDDIAVIKSMH